MKFRKVIYYAAFITSCTYIIWRIFFTLPFGKGIFSVTFGILLLLSEIAGFIESANIYHGMVDIFIPEKAEIEEKEYPHVDIFIATYNEPVELVLKTINGCKNMDYPDKNKVHIFLCDDGHRSSMKALARKMNVTCIHRADHVDAKAGNYNHALSCTNSPLVATFDADMIPMHNFLTELVPYFYSKDEKIGFIQSPQSFYNPDLFQYNLYSEKKVPNEQNFFFQQVQVARNKSNAAIYGGSNTIILREALEEVGGFYTKSITEDLATGLLIQSKGYKGYAIGKVLASGLSPEDIESLFKQRERWARGCIQTWRNIKIIRNKELDWKQKKDYFFSAFYWYTPIRRCSFILAPILSSVFNIPVLTCTIKGLIIFWLPQVIIYNIALSSLTGNIRTARLSNVYDTIIFPYLFLKVILETFGVTQSKFKVTKKGKIKHNQSFISRYNWFFRLLFLLSVIGIGRCILIMLSQQSIGMIIILFWLMVNLHDIIMALNFLRERKIVRESYRLAIKQPVEVICGSIVMDTSTVNISEGGVAVAFDFPYYIPQDEKVTIRFCKDSRYQCSFFAKIIYVHIHQDKWRYGFRFEEMQEHDYFQLLGILYDREPVLPVRVSEKSSFYDDLRTNLTKRFEKEVFSFRKFPRIKLDVLCMMENGKYIHMKDFNYEYVRFDVDELPEMFSLTPIEYPDLVFVCQQTNIRSGVCKIINKTELYKNKEFTGILYSWMEQRKALLVEQEKLKKKFEQEDELNEMDFITDRKRIIAKN